MSTGPDPTPAQQSEGRRRSESRATGLPLTEPEADIVIDRWSAQSAAAEEQLSGLLAAYHLRTEAEKGGAVADVAELPERYRAEVLDPGAAFADDIVLVASSGNTAVGCLVLAAPVEGRAEIKRLWEDPDIRGQAVATGLIDAALGHATRSGVRTVRLSVWKWRTGAIGLYGRLGFNLVESWDERGQLACMERSV